MKNRYIASFEAAQIASKEIPAPKLVKTENTKRFIRESPAGKEIYCLTTGINLPKNVEI